MFSKVISISDKVGKLLGKGMKVAALATMVSATVASTAFAADTIKIYADKSVEGNANSGYYAYGYVKCEPYHYTRVRLIEKSTNKIVKDSGRKYGYDKVETTTQKN